MFPFWSTFVVGEYCLFKSTTTAVTSRLMRWRRTPAPLDLQGLSKHLPLDLIDRVNALRRVERYISFSEIVDFSIEDAVYDAYSMEKELMYI